MTEGWAWAAGASPMAASIATTTITRLWFIVRPLLCSSGRAAQVTQPALSSMALARLRGKREAVGRA